MQIPFYVVYDADGKCRANDREKNKRDNLCLMQLCSVLAAEPFPADICWVENMAVWPNKIKDTVRQDFGDGVWNGAQNVAREKHDLNEGVRAKNPTLIAYTLANLYKQSKQSKSLIKLCGSILRYAEKVRIG